MSDFKMTPSPDDMSDTGILRLIGDLPSLNAETVANGRVNELWPDGPVLPDDLEPYIDCNGKRCWRPKGHGERMRLENRLKRLREVQHHEDMLRAEAAARRK